jgi:hypothetical protein
MYIIYLKQFYVQCMFDGKARYIVARILRALRSVVRVRIPSRVVHSSADGPSVGSQPSK